jgi:hypothetical protein
MASQNVQSLQSIGRGIRTSAPAIACYFATSFIVVGAVWFADDTVLPRLRRTGEIRGNFMAWDGAEYAAIARDGYAYHPSHQSNVAFFPAYPLAARCVAYLTGWSVQLSLVLVANACLVAAFVLLHRYALRRVGAIASDANDGLVNVDVPNYAVLAMGVWPMTVFFRMAYSESLFLLVTILAMYAMDRRFGPVWVAFLVGLATACRPVGVAVLAPFALYLWQRATPYNAPAACSESPISSRAARRFIKSALWLMPLACWGILVFMLFQYMAFGDPLAFAKTQQFWGKRAGVGYLEQWGMALLLEPIWSVYDPSSPAYWANQRGASGNPIFSMAFANPIFFVGTIGLIWVGWRKGWLNGREVLLAAFLLGIAYFTQSYRNMMLSQGRFAAVAFPVYLVLGRLAARAPAPVVALCAALSACLLAAYAALFAAWYRIT